MEIRDGIEYCDCGNIIKRSEEGNDIIDVCSECL